MDLTEGDIKKIEEEISYRKSVVRPQTIADVKEAKSHGDLSENFEYYAAKKAKSRNDSRIRYLEKLIRTANVISTESKEDEVGINNRVKVWFEDDDETEEYKIVSTIRGNSLEGCISNESPVGKALLGHKVGDRVFVPVGEDGYYLVIKEISKTTDEDDDIKAY